MSVLPCALRAPLRSTGRHAAPRTPLAPGARAAVAGGLAVALLPLAAPAAAADEVVTPSSSATGTATTQPAEQAPAEQAAEQPAADEADQPAAEETDERATTVVRFSAPSRDQDGRVPVSVRLLADGAAVQNGLVRLERKTPSGWTYVGRLLTNAQGLGRGTLPVASTSDLRAAYTGTSTRTPAASAARTVVIPLEQAGSSFAVRSRKVMHEAARQVGKPYRYGAVGPSSFDCSGFTRYVFAKVGKSLPHNSHAQERATVRVSKAAAKPGDLVFIKDVAGHVGIYAGNGKMYDAPRAGKNVTLRKIWTANYVVGRVK